MVPSPYIQILRSFEQNINSNDIPSGALILDPTRVLEVQKQADYLGLALICPSDLASSHQGDGYWTHDATVIKSLRAKNQDWQLVGLASDRHSAMVLGEAGADLILFGQLTPLVLNGDLDLGRWWSELFEVPCAVVLQTPPQPHEGFGQPGMPEFYAV